jgi:hypothetical protein
MGAVYEFFQETPSLVLLAVVLVVAWIGGLTELRAQRRRKRELRRRARNLFEARQRQRLRDAKRKTPRK